MPPGRAMWVWVPEASPPDPAALAALAHRERVAEAFVSVPWVGPSDATRASVAALRAAGARVAALGGEPSWTDGDRAVEWMRRAIREDGFTGVHLDIEPWTRADWAGREHELLGGLARAVAGVASATALPVEVDLAPWLAEAQPAGFAAIASAADAVTLLAYRDRASAIVDSTAAARRLLEDAGRRYRIGVETGAVRAPAPAPRETFADDGRAVLERELAAVGARLAGDARFAGIAVHDFEGWRSLRP